MAGSNATLEPDGAPLYGAVLRLDHELPGKLIGARRAGIAAGAAQNRPGDVVFRRSAFALEFAENLVAALVCPDAAAQSPVALSMSAITSERKPVPGRPGPASSIDPLRSMIELRRSAPREMVWRLPVAFQEPSNSRHSPAVARDFVGSATGLQAVMARARATMADRHHAHQTEDGSRDARASVSSRAVIVSPHPHEISRFLLTLKY